MLLHNSSKAFSGHSGMFLLLATCFAGSFIAVKETLTAIAPLQATGLRIAVGLVALGLLSSLRGQSLRIPRNLLLKVWGSGLLLHSVALSLLFWGMQYVGPGLGGILESTIPIFTFLLSSLCCRNKTHSTQSRPGLALGIIGIVLIFVEKMQFSGSVDEVFGILAILLMSAAYALGTHLTKEIVNKAPSISSSALVFQQNLASFFVICLVAVPVEGVPHWDASTLSASVVFSILYLGIFPTAIGSYIYARLVKEWGAVRSSAVCYVVPAMAVGLDFAVYGNVLSFHQWVGCGFILLGVFLIQNPGHRFGLQLNWQLPNGRTLSLKGGSVN